MPYYLTEYNRTSNRAIYWEPGVGTTIRVYPNGAEGYSTWPPLVNTQFATIPVPNPPDPNAPPPTSGLPGTPAELAEAIDDRVAALLGVGSGLTETYDDPGNSLILAAIANSGAAGLKIITSIKDDLIAEPVTTGIVYCKQYWPGTVEVGKGGLFAWDALSTRVVDNGIVFAGAGSPTTGRWIRFKGGAIPSIDDFGAVGTTTPYNRDVSFATNGAPQVLLSAKFAGGSALANAQAWYSTSSIAALTESLNSAAIQQGHIRQSALFIPEGAYWLNRSIEFTRDRALFGISTFGSSLLFDASAGAGFKPKANNDNVANSNANMKNCDLHDFGIYSNAMPYDPGTGAVTANSVTFDETKSGFYLPKRSLGAEAALGNPLMESCRWYNLYSARFAGHAFFLGNVFSCKFDNLKGDQCKGWGYRYYSSVGCELANSYVGRFNQTGGYWLEQPGRCVNLNGLDTFGDYKVMVQVGDPASSQKVVGQFISCNFEGVRDALEIYGDGTEVDFQACTWQWYLAPTAGTQQTTDLARPTIRCFGGGGRIKFDDTCYFSYSANSATLVPTNFLWVRGTAWDITCQAKCDAGVARLKWYVVGATGADDVFGYGFQNGFRLQPVLNQFLSNAGSLYAKYFQVHQRVSVEMLAVGYNQDTGAGESSARGTGFAMLVSGNGAPNGAANQLMRMPKGSLYLRLDGTGAGEVLYVCTGFDAGTGVSTWVAK